MSTAVSTSTPPPEPSRQDGLRKYVESAAQGLQAPLRRISGNTQLLARRYGGRLDAEADQLIGLIIGDVERLQRLLDGLLVYSEAGAGADALEEVDCDLLMHQVLEALRERIESSRATIVQTPLPSIKGDRRALRQLFSHLVGNALDAAGDEPPDVQIGARREDGTWHLSVHDQGVGIAPDQQERIFDLFTRLQGPTEGSGSGIGLALCRKIVERHGGRIWVESEAGRGATFNVSLPAEEAPKPVRGRRRR